MIIKNDSYIKTNSKEFEKQDEISTKFKFPYLKVGIIIPAYNEEMNIKKVLSRIPKNISNNLDVIVIDDGSTDNTSEIAQYQNSIILKHEINKGNGAATITGLKFCEKNKYNIAIILDADGQHDPEYIPEFLNAIINDKADFVIGNRFKYYYEMNPYKKLCSKMMTAFYFVFLRKKISDPTNGYRALSYKLIKSLNFESQYSITQEMLFKVLPNYKYKEIPIKVNQRENGTSFIRLNNYFSKMILFFIKYYLFPKIRKFSEKIFKEETRRNIGLYIFKT